MTNRLLDMQEVTSSNLVSPTISIPPSSRWGVFFYVCYMVRRIELSLPIALLLDGVFIVVDSESQTLENLQKTIADRIQRRRAQNGLFL